jgi:type II secretory pathway pseudopilin PulG
MLKQLFSKKKSFTLLEMLLVIAVLAILIPTIFLAYSTIQQTKNEIDVRQQLVQQTYEFFERINLLSQDYTIDYEEYFNRQMVGCSSAGEAGTNFTRTTNGSGYCDKFTAYGNKNSIYTSTVGNKSPENHHYYYCYSVSSGTPVPAQDSKYEVFGTVPCQQESYQSYGQYSKLFYNVKTDIDGDGSAVGDSDDEDLGAGPAAIKDPNQVQELYLISPDGKNRLYFRRKLIEQEDMAGDGVYDRGEQLFVIQILRLRGFDAGTKHNFSSTNGNDNPGLYDGQIDTRACDASQGFMGSGASIGGAYPEYHLPANADDCWVDLYQGAISLDAWNLTIYPDSDPSLAWKEPAYQINPSIKIFLLNRVYIPAWKFKIKSTPKDFQVAVETTFNTKNFYTVGDGYKPGEATSNGGFLNVKCPP